MNIVNYIPIGHKNAITRGELCRRTGLGDRKIRRMIEKARQDFVILNLGDSKGYFLPGIGEENLVEIYKRQELSRYVAIGRTIRTMDKYLCENFKSAPRGIPGQMTLFGGGSL